jgi:hypothetical protein
VLRLDAVLPDLPDAGRPALLSEVLREDGPDVSAPVGDTDRGEEVTYSIPIVDECALLPKSSDGISGIKVLPSETSCKVDTWK